MFSPKLEYDEQQRKEQLWEERMDKEARFGTGPAKRDEAAIEAIRAELAVLDLEWAPLNRDQGLCQYHAESMRHWNSEVGLKIRGLLQHEYDRLEELVSPIRAKVRELKQKLS